MKKAQCSRCGEIQPVSAFAKDVSKAVGHKTWCKACDRERCRRYYHENREAVLARQKARYSATRAAPSS